MHTRACADGRLFALVFLLLLKDLGFYAMRSMEIGRRCAIAHAIYRSTCVYTCLHPCLRTYVLWAYPQDERSAAIRRYKKGQIRLMVATDVAARGLDIKCVVPSIVLSNVLLLQQPLQHISVAETTAFSYIHLFCFLHPAQLYACFVL